MSCLLAKPIVNGIEKDLQGRAKVIRLNMLSRLGREAAKRFAVSAMPTLLVLDGKGDVLHRHAGMPNRKQVVDQTLAA
jgi:thiol-disulfide isomerase/thioredoxin